MTYLNKYIIVRVYKMQEIEKNIIKQKIGLIVYVNQRKYLSKILILIYIYTHIFVKKYTVRSVHCIYIMQSTDIKLLQVLFWTLD